MPRDITVTFSDGTTHVYKNAPDNLTPEAVTQRAQQDFSGLTVKSLDGGRSSAKPASPAKTPTTAVGRPVPKKDALLPTDAKRIWDEQSARLEQKIANLPENIKQQARDKFFASPAIKRLRVASAQPAGPATTAKDRGRRKAEALANTGIGKYLPGSNFFSAVSDAAGRAMFSLPELIGAGLPGLIAGDDGNMLEETRARTDYNRERSTTGNILGTIAGSVMGGVGAGAAARGVGSRVAASGAGKVARAAGRALEGAATVRSGQTFRNAAKLVASGAAAGGAQFASEGQDVGTGAALGAAGAAVVPTLARGVSFAARPLADFLRLSNAGTLLRRITTASREEIEQAAAQYRNTTGSEPTLYELLPLADRNKLARDVVGRSPGTREQTAAAVRQRVSNVGPELQSTTRRATGARRQEINEQMASDMATAAGREPNRGVLPGGTGGDRSPADMAAFRRAEANATMAPYENTVVADDLESLFPTSLGRNPVNNEVQEVFSDPEVNNALQAAAGSVRLRLSPAQPTADVAGLSAGDMTRILRKLSKVDATAPNKAAALRAEGIIMDLMERNHPEAAQTVARMRQNYASRSRMLEGMNEGGMGRTRESVRVANNDTARELRNAYETPEGTAGRFLGQSNRLQREFGGTPQDALRRASDIAESGETQAALRQNLGDDAASAITRASEAQGRSLRNLGSLSREKGDVADSLGAEDFGRMILALNPSSMPTTKLAAISRLATLTHMPESRATQIVDSLFSQDPAKTNAAINLLKRAGPNGNTALAAIGRGLFQMTQGGDPASENIVPQADAATMPENLIPEAMGDGQNNEGDQTDNSGTQEFGSYDEVLDDFYANEDPEFVDLWERQTNQESGRKQFDSSGNPLTSSAGAVGVAQVMPETAPEAARLAGLDWDEDAYRNDPAYNELLGIAYMKEMLRRFDGDVELALAAYNAGPGAVEKAGNRVPRIAETQDYVRRILGG